MAETRFGILLSFLFSALLCVLNAQFFLVKEIHFFIPALVSFIYRSSLQKSCFISLLIGLFTDSFLLSPRLGIFGASYFVACFACYRFKKYLFRDSLSTLPLMSYLFSFLIGISSSLIAVVLEVPSSLCFTKQILKWLVCPMYDVANALIFFSLPSMIFSAYYRKKQREK